MVFLFNMILTSTYFLLDLFDWRKMDKLEFIFLLAYCVISMVVFGELLQEEKKDSSN
jgi:hypothetical protein